MTNDTNGARTFRRRLDDPGLVQMLDHWCQLRTAAGNRIPPRRNFDPMRIPKLLPRLEVYRRTPEGRLRCALSGTGVVREVGRDLTGLYLDQMLAPEQVEGRARLFERPLASGRPIAYRCRLPVPGREHKAITRLLLPMTDDSGKPSVVLSMTAFAIAPLRSDGMQPEEFEAPDAELRPG